MTYQEAQIELCRSLNIDFTDIANNDLISLTDIKNWLKVGIKRAWDFKPWDFSEGAKTETVQVGDVTNGYIDYPTDIQSGSISMLLSSAEEDPFEKLLYKDYMKWRKQHSGDDDLYYSEYKRFLFINPKAVSVGDVLDIYGKLKAPVLTNDNDLMPFSPDSDNQEYSGNDAIVALAYAEALYSDKKKNSNQARLEEKRAFEMLELLWKPFADSRSLLQSKNNPAFDVPDFFSGRSSGTSEEGKFSI